MRSVSGLVVVLAMSLLIVGCGGNEKLAPVSGVVTLNGDPVEGATVTFTPVGTTDKEAPTSFGVTDEEGRYTLKTGAGDAGAFIGKNRVSIVKQKGGKDDADDSQLEFESEIPPEYNENTTLQFEVPKEGSTEADFKLKAEKGWQKKAKKRN